MVFEVAPAEFQNVTNIESYPDERILWRTVKELTSSKM